MKCKSCGSENTDNAKFCVQCGEGLSTNIKCPKCGFEIKDGAQYCPDCGESLLAEDKKKKNSKQQKVKNRSKKPIKKIWLILGGIFVVLLLFGIWIFSTPKECIPLRDALDTNEEFTYGCDMDACYLWLQNMDGIDGIDIVYAWRDSEEERGNCKPDPDAEKGLRCIIRLPEETGSNLNISLATDKCRFSFTTVSGEEMDAVMPNLDAWSSLSSDPKQCADFQTAADNSISEVNFTYSPVEIELWPIIIDQPYLGLRYLWSNGVYGAVDCVSEEPGEFNCYFPAEMGDPRVEFWLNDGTCESLLLAADESMMNWNDEAYASCSEDFVNKLKEMKGQWRFTYEQDDTKSDLFTFWVPGITEFKDISMLFTIDDNIEDRIPADSCIVKEDGPSGMPELGCSIKLEQMPDVVIMYAITKEDCQIYAGYTETEEIMEYLEANPGK